MNTVSPLFTSLSTPATTSPPAANNLPSSQADFLTLLAAQMKYQDPDSPMSGTDFATQLAQFSTLQGIQEMNTNFSSMLMAQAANLIGTNVTYTNSGAAAPSNGVVGAIQMGAAGNVELVIGTNTVPLAQVSGIK
jgi:flagellar basal-body rod modification protein FlgD